MVKVKKEESWVGKLKRRVKKLLSKEKETTRTKAVKRRLRNALTEDEIKSLQGKK